MLSICSKITGTQRYLSFDEKWSWKVNSNNYLLGGSDHNSIEPLFRIHGIEIPELIEKKYRIMAKELNLESPNYAQLIGNKFKTKLVNTTEDVYANIKRLESHRYTKFYFETNKWLWTLTGAPIDIIRYNSIKKSHNISDIQHDGKNIIPIRYDRSKIKTGRLSVIQGPPITTMNSDWRNIAKNCRQIDFSSMEPMFLLNVSGQKIKGDLYEWVASNANLKGDRSYTKIAIISSLYGSARQIPAVTKLFALDEWEKQLEANVSNGIIENYYGRPIQCQDIKGRHLLSLWLQSSAADAAIKGFSSFFENNKNLNPHWLIHDACIFSGNGTLPDKIIIDDMNFPIKSGAV